MTPRDQDADIDRDEDVDPAARAAGIGRVCVFGTFDTGRHPRVGILAEGLRAAGVEVVTCNVPWDAPTRLRVAALRRPWLLVVLAWRLLRAWVGLRREARGIGDVEVVVVGYLGVLDVRLARRWWPRATVVLDHLAPVGGTVSDRGAGGLRARLATRLDRWAEASADLVVVDTPEHLPAAGGVVVAVGAPEAWFAARPITAGPAAADVRRGLSVAFFGLYTPLQGATTIAAGLAKAIDAGDVARATLIGDGQDRVAAQARLAGRQAVRWLDWVDPAQLPALVAEHDVCLGILGTTPKAHRVVPNKVFQGAAAGCAIVTSDTAPQRRVLGPAARYVPVPTAVSDPADDPAVDPADDPADDPATGLATVLAQLARDPAALAAARRSAAERADVAFRPVEVVAPLLAALAEQ